MSHPEHILKTLDGHLLKPTRLILYGRAALALGFPDASPEFHATMDVDAILPEVELSSIEADESFWEAIEKTNEELQPSGLYLTHLFADSQVILRSSWLETLAPINLAGLRCLKLLRPSVEDLILTKMMRVDPQDRSDIRFLLDHLVPRPPEPDRLLRQARVPAVAEIQEAFSENAEWLRAVWLSRDSKS